jgi:DNA-binding MarR family transcriptional regulator
MTSLQSISEIVAEVEKATRLRVFTRQYSIISYVYERGASSPQAIMSGCGVPSSTLFAALNGLKQSGLMEVRDSRTGSGNHCYDLTPHTRNLLECAFLSIHAWMKSRPAQRGENRFGSMHDRVKMIEEDLGIRYYSIEYRIAVNIYEAFEIRAIDLLETGEYSSTALFYTLKRLTGMGIIESWPDPQDLRSRIYCLSDRIRTVMDEAHREIFERGLLVN